MLRYAAALALAAAALGYGLARFLRLYGLL